MKNWGIVNGMVMQGKGYKELKQRRLDEGIPAGRTETPENAEYCVYIGRAHLHDHETGVLARGPVKMGRAKYTETIARGRNQSGIDFRIYAQIMVETDRDSWHLESVFHELLKDHHFVGSQGQRELYRVSDAELKNVLTKFSDSYSVGTSGITDVRVYI